MFQSRLTDIVEPRNRAKPEARFFSQFKISSQKIEILARGVDLFLIAIASTFGGIVYQQIWHREPRHASKPACVPALSAACYTFVRSVRAVCTGFPCCSRRFPHIGRLLAIFASTSLLVVGSLVLVNGNLAFPASPLVAALLPQMILLVLARWVFAKATNALLSRGEPRRTPCRDDRRTGGTAGIECKFPIATLWFAGSLSDRSSQRIAGTARPSSWPVWTAPSRQRANMAPRNFWWRCAGTDKSCSKQFAPAFASLRFRSGFCLTIPSEPCCGQHGSSADGLPLPVTIQRAPLTSFERVVKRTLDVIGSVTAILILWPLFLIAAIAIKLDSGGPIIFRQRRTGFNAKEFVIYKFRTMTVLEDGPAITQACRGDRSRDTCRQISPPVEHRRAAATF